VETRVLYLANVNQFIKGGFNQALRLSSVWPNDERWIDIIFLRALAKAFTTQLVGLFLLTMTLAKMRGRLPESPVQAYMRELRLLPSTL
jgi:hypothetical protein